MSEEKKDQAQVNEQSEKGEKVEKAKTIAEGIAQFREKELNKEPTLKEGEKALEEEKKIEEAKAKEECPECKEFLHPETNEPAYRVIKRQGKVIPVWTEKEYDTLASEGLDYTVKTQDLAGEKKEVGDLRGKVEGTANLVTGIMEKINLDSRFKAPATGVEKPEEPIFDEETIEELDLTPKTKELLEGLIRRDRDSEKRIKQADEKTNILTMHLMGNYMATVGQQAEKEFPLEYVIDDNKNNLTQKEIATVIASKWKGEESKPSAQQKPIQEIIRESFKEVHDRQQFQKKKIEETAGKTNQPLTLEEIKEKHPEDYEKLLKEVQATNQPAEEEEESEPSITSTKAEVKIKKEKKEKKTIHDAVEQYRKDQGI